MNIRDQQYIKVMNFELSQVCIDGKTRGYAFPPAGDDGPAVEYMSFQDIEYADSRSPVFTSGLLRFDEDIEEAVFSELKHFNWREKMWTESDIENVILSPTLENQNRIIAVKDILTIERIRGKAVRMINGDNESITAKIVELINSRFAEINAGKINSTLPPFIRKVAASDSASSEEIDAMKEKNEALESKLSEMSKMVEKLMAEKHAAEKPDSERPAQPAKPAARAAKKTQPK